MNTNKKLIYALVCALALQAAVPAQAGIWSSITTWWNHVPEQSRRTVGIVAAALTALCALGYSAYALRKKRKKVISIEMLMTPAMSSVAPVGQAEAKRAAVAQPAPAAEPASASLAAQRSPAVVVPFVVQPMPAVAVPQRDADAKVSAAVVEDEEFVEVQGGVPSDDDQKTKAAQMMQTASTLVSGVVRATSPVVMNGLSVAGSTIAQGASSVASATGSAASSVASVALSGMQAIRRESTPAFSRIEMKYAVHYDCFMEGEHARALKEYNDNIRKQDFNAAAKTLQKLKNDYNRLLIPLFREAQALQPSLAGKEYSQVTQWMNKLSAIEAFIDLKRNELAYAQQAAQQQRREGDSKRR